MTAAQIFSGVRSSDLSAESALFHMVWKYRGNNVIDKETAEDLAQDALLKCWIAIRSGEVRKPEALASFVGTVHRNVKLQWMRQQRPVLELIDPIDFRTPESEYAQTQAVNRVMQAVDKLEPRDREVLLSWVNGETLREIGERLGLTLAGTKTLHHRAKQKVRQDIAGCLTQR